MKNWNWKMYMYIVVALLGALNVFLQLWLLALGDGQIIWLGLGFWFIFVGVVAFRREQSEIKRQNL